MHWKSRMTQHLRRQRNQSDRQGQQLRVGDCMRLQIYHNMPPKEQSNLMYRRLLIVRPPLNSRNIRRRLRRLNLMLLVDGGDRARKHLSDIPCLHFREKDLTSKIFNYSSTMLCIGNKVVRQHPWFWIDTTTLSVGIPPHHSLSLFAYALQSRCGFTVAVIPKFTVL